MTAARGARLIALGPEPSSAIVVRTASTTTSGDQAAETRPPDRQRGEPGGKAEPLEDEPTDDDRQADEAQTTDEPGEHEARARSLEQE